jgi:outer membrane lipoprotein SlyB
MIMTKGRPVLLPLILAVGLGACASNAVQPGIVHTTAGQPGVVTTSSNVPPPPPPAASSTYNGSVAGPGRVVSIREIALQGGGGGYRSSGQGTMTGGFLGAAAGAALGGAIGQTVGSSLVGLLLGAVGGAIAGNILDGQQSGGRGIEIVVQRDDGQNVTIAQRDDGDVQLGDRVQIVQDGRGVARAVRDTSRAPD